MNRKDPAFEAKGILRQLERVESVERAMRLQTRDGWEPEAIDRACKFVAKLNDEQANMSPSNVTRLDECDLTAVTNERIATKDPSTLNPDHARRITHIMHCVSYQSVHPRDV